MFISAISETRPNDGSKALEAQVAGRGTLYSKSKHQLLYTHSGSARLETTSTQFVVPPQRVAWVPAGALHNVHLNRAQVGAVHFDAAWAPAAANVQVFDAPPLLREMTLYALRWPEQQAQTSGDVRRYLQSLLLVLFDSMKNCAVYELPRPRSDVVTRAVLWIQAHLVQATLLGAAEAAQTSPRTLRRHFAEETGLTFSAFITHVRVQRAMELLCDPSRTILAIAQAVGFRSHAAFSHAFLGFTGQTPRAFRSHWQVLKPKRKK